MEREASHGREVGNPDQTRWIRSARQNLARAPNVTFLPRTTVFGHYDNNCLAALQKLAEPGEIPAGLADRNLLYVKYLGK